MNTFLLFSIATAAVSGVTTRIDEALFSSINALAGRSYVADSLIAIPAYHGYVGAAVLGSCFLFTWALDGKPEDIRRRRRILLTAVMAALLAVAATETISHNTFRAAPYVLSQKTFHLGGTQLEARRRLSYRVPLDRGSQRIFSALKNGEIAQADLNSFPGGHAALYLTLAVAILLAHRKAGFVALGWTLFVTLGSRVFSGLNSPVDIAVGSGIGAAIILVFHFGARTIGRRTIDSIAGWTLEHRGISTAALFVYLLDALNMFAGTRGLLAVVSEVGKQVLRG